jgi:hypothetical protein
MAVTVKAVSGTKPSFEAGAPQPLFEAVLAQAPGDTMFQYDATADGRRFLLSTIAGASATQLNVVVNWEAGLKK